MVLGFDNGCKKNIKMEIKKRGGKFILVHW